MRKTLFFSILRGLAVFFVLYFVVKMDIKVFHILESTEGIIKTSSIILLAFGASGFMVTVAAVIAFRLKVVQVIDVLALLGTSMLIGTLAQFFS